METDFRPLMRDVAERLLGEPNKDLSSKTELRYGSRGSMAIDLSTGRFYDHEKGEGGGVLGLIQRERGLDKGEAFQWLVDEGLAEPNKPNGAWSDRITVHYEYHDADGKLLYTVARLKDPKDFRQYRQHPTIPNQRVWSLKAGDYVQHQKESTNWYKATAERTPEKGFTKRLTLTGVQHTLFHLPALMARDMVTVVYLCEGEKDCLNLEARGFLATTNSGGAKYWAARHVEYLRGADVVIPIDNDPAGRERGDKLATSLNGKARRVRVLDIAAIWPECPPKGDISDWFRDGGGTPERLTEIVAGLPDWEPPPKGEGEPEADPTGDFKRGDKGIYQDHPGNIRLALKKMGVTLRYDLFADHPLIDGLEGFGPVLNDHATNRLWLATDERFHFRPKIELMRTVVDDAAYANRFHPVRDYLAGLKWDGEKRLDGWLTTVAGAADSAYTRAVGSLMLIAAVRRVRKPGVKFDEMVVFIQKQGTDKSTGLATLAVNPEWFTDDLPLNADTQKVIERIRGRWIIEASDLSGMKRADTEHLKSLLSRRVDRARKAYGHLPEAIYRECIIVGTTNEPLFLRDRTGNRRFWPIVVKGFNIPLLLGIRDQLWAEAAEHEARGESIRLAPKLWPAAAEEQDKRLIKDPYVTVLSTKLGHIENGRIRSTDVWTILNLSGAALTPDAYARTSEAMRAVGWRRPPNKSSSCKFEGRQAVGFMIGDGKPIITAQRNQYGDVGVFVGTDEPDEGDDEPERG